MSSSPGVTILDESAELRALALMRESLALLDSSDAPPHIGAHLDLAIERLREHLAMEVENLKAVRSPDERE